MTIQKDRIAAPAKPTASRSLRQLWTTPALVEVDDYSATRGGNTGAVPDGTISAFTTFTS